MIPLHSSLQVRSSSIFSVQSKGICMIDYWHYFLISLFSYSTFVPNNMLVLLNPSYIFCPSFQPPVINYSTFSYIFIRVQTIPWKKLMSQRLNFNIMINSCRWLPFLEYFTNKCWTYSAKNLNRKNLPLSSLAESFYITDGCHFSAKVVKTIALFARWQRWDGGRLSKLTNS